MTLTKCDNAIGTCLQGSIEAAYGDLVDILGEPHSTDHVDSNVRAEWFFRFHDGEIVTVYDWKESCPIEDVTHWNIGGNNSVVVGRMREIIAGEATQ